MRGYRLCLYQKWEGRNRMLPGFVMWLLGVPLVVIVLLYVFHVL